MVLNWKKVFCGLFAGLALSAAAGEVRFRDGGFESYRKQTGDLYWWRLVSPESGSALADKEKHSGRYSLKIVPSGNEARVKYLRGIFKTHPGRVYTLCVWAKGSASLGAEVQFRREIPGQPGGWARKMPVVRLKEFALTPEWKKYTFTFSGKDPSLYSMEMFFVIRGKGKAAWLDDTKIETSAREGNLDSMRSCVVVKKGATAHFRTRGKLSPDGVAVLSGALEKVNGKNPVLPVKEVISIKTPQQEGCYPFAMIHSQLQDGRRHYIHVVESAQYDRLEKLASAVKTAPGKVLVLGDSLSDYLRGYNWVGIVEDFLRKRFPGKTAFYNYAVGGDLVPRVLARLKGVKGTYALERYKGIWEVDPEWILISLGQNDTLSLDRSKGAASPVRVPPEQFTSGMKEIVSLLRKRFPKAGIVLFTPYTMCIEKTRKHFFANRKLMYGQPEIVLRYVDLVKALGKELNCAVLDVHTPFRQLKDRAPYFLYDGIHLNVKGNFYASEQVLRFFGEKRILMK